MPSLVPTVKSKLFIHSTRKSMQLLDGAYASLLHGRSHDFEDLREYVHGDNVRDIDWRATARFGQPLVKRSRATRVHTVLLVVDTGRSMAALAADDQPKRELAVLAAGMLGLLAIRHGDAVSVLHGDADAVRRVPPGRSEGALEHALRTIDRAIAGASRPSDREALLTAVTRTVSRRAIVVVITDEAPVTDDTDRLLRRLTVQHDVLWVTVRDAEPVLDARSRAARRDVDTGWGVPDYLHGDPAIVAEIAALRAEQDARRDGILDRLEVSHVDLGTQSDAVASVLRMLHRRSDVGA